MKTFFTNHLRLMVLLGLLTSYLGALAQAPSVVPSVSGGTSHNIPFTASTTGYRHQSLYLPGEFIGAVADKYINKIYVRTATASSNMVFTNLQVSLGQSSTTSLTTASWHPVSTVFSASSYAVPNTSTGGWVAITLPTPFAYDPTQSLVVEFRFTAISGTGFNVYSNTAVTGNRRAYSTNPAATVPATANANRFDIGFDLINIRSGYNNARVIGITEPSLFCAGNYDVKVKVGNKGVNDITFLTLQWSLDNVPQSPLYLYNLTLDTLDSPNNSSDSVFTLGNVSFAGAGRHIRVWTEYPNGVADTINTDDTLNILLKPSLSGTYTIGGTSPDYATFDAAISDLHSYGVCGPVVFNVAPNTYSGQLRINQIPGASPVNTVTFEGASAQNTILTHSSSVTDSRHTVLLNGSKYIRFRNLTIRSTGSFGWPVHMLAMPAAPVNNITISNCVLDIAGTTGPTATTNNFAGIIINGHVSTPTTGGRADSITIDSNVFNYGYYGVAIVGLTGNLGLDNRFTNNTFNQQSYNGLWLTFQDGAKVDGNRITGRTTGLTYGIYYASCTSTAPRLGSIQRNRLNNVAVYAIMLSASNNGPTNMGLIANNMIGGNFTNGGASGIVSNNCSYWKIYHNSVVNNAEGTDPGCSALNVTSGSDLDVQNNIFAVTHPSSIGVVVTAANASSFSVMNNNIYYKADTSNGILNIGTVLYPHNFKGNGGLNVNSLYADPGLSSDTLLLISGGCNNGANLGITTDINGQTRSVTAPDMGCIEFQAAANDLAVEAVKAPVFPIPTGMNDVVVSLRNLGNNTLYSAVVSYTYNNTPVSIMWSGTLNTCDVTDVTFDFGNQVNIQNTTLPLKVYTASPNGVSDGNLNNDTLTVKVGPPLTGIYTIGGSTPDFPSISEAVEALHSVGIAAPVQFNIRTGTYTENAMINPIKGASLQNTILFTSEAAHRDSVVINYNTAALNSDGYVFKLFNASSISFKKLTVQALMAAANGFELGGIASNDTIEDCRIALASTVSGQTAGVYGARLTSGNIVVKNNLISGGYYNVYFAGYNVESKLSASVMIPVDNVTIEGNTLTGAGYSSAFLQFHSGLKYRNNTSAFSGSTATACYGVYVVNCDTAVEITGNRISATGVSASTVYGLRVSNCNNGPLQPGMIANNSVVVGTSGNGSYGFSMATNTNFNYLNNNVNSISTGTTNYAAHFSFTSANYSSNVVRNNIFSNRGTTGYAMFVQDPSFMNSDYNVLFSTGSGGLVYKGVATATAYPSLTAYRTAYPLQEVNSKQYRPPFVSNTDLGINTSDTACWVLNGRGIHTTNNTDINGNPRSTTITGGASDIGAYEFTPTVPAPRATAVPAQPAAGITQAFLMLGDTVARITWDPFSSYIPDSIFVRFYSGEYAPGTNPSHFRTNCYWDIEEFGVGYYVYAIDLYYKETMKGSIVTESDMRMTKKHANDPWVWYTGSMSSVDVNRNILSAANLNTFSVFTGTDNHNPLPVKLNAFNAARSGKDVNVSWTTASERNASHFLIEASSDGRTFRTVGKVSARGNSSVSQSYRFIHNDAQRSLNNAGTVWYRLTSVDRDGSQEQSAIVRVDFGRSENLNSSAVYPNPFTGRLNLQIPSVAGGEATLELIDLQGRIIGESVTLKLEAGVNQVETESFATADKGIYLLKITLGGESTVIRIVKQ